MQSEPRTARARISNGICPDQYARRRYACIAAKSRRVGSSDRVYAPCARVSGSGEVSIRALVYAPRLVSRRRLWTPPVALLYDRSTRKVAVLKTTPFHARTAPLVLG